MTLPNALTFLRVFLIPPLVTAIIKGNFQTALWIAAVAGLTDILDGYLARAFNWQSRLGSVIDPAADKLLIFGCYYALMMIAVVPGWLFYLVLARDVVITGGMVFLTARGYMRDQVHPSILGKLTVAFLMGLAVLSIIGLNFELELALEPLYLVAALLTVISLVQYLWIGGRLIRQNRDRATA